MQRPGRKNLRLQEKLDAIQREIARVEGDIKGISNEFPERQPGSTPVYRGTAGAPDDGLTAPVPRTVPDQRFTTYFGSSGLHSVRPLRQERRVQRNKAIFMLCIAGLVIFLVLKMIL